MVGKQVINAMQEIPVPALPGVSLPPHPTRLESIQGLWDRGVSGEGGSRPPGPQGLRHIQGRLGPATGPQALRRPHPVSLLQARTGVSYPGAASGGQEAWVPGRCPNHRSILSVAHWGWARHSLGREEQGEAPGFWCP